jgi:hypothetical protein
MLFPIDTVIHRYPTIDQREHEPPTHLVNPIELRHAEAQNDYGAPKQPEACIVVQKFISPGFVVQIPPNDSKLVAPPLRIHKNRDSQK